MTNDTETSKSDQLIERAEKNAAEAATKRKAKPVSDKPKKSATKKAAKPKAAKKPAKAKAAERAPRLALSEKQLAEPRETIRILPAIKRMIEKYGKTKGLEVNEAAEKMLMTAVGRLGALARYNAE